MRVKNRWRVYHPEHPKASNLFRLSGSRAYLIKVKPESAPWTLEVLGQPTPSDPYWVAGDFSLKGFSIDPSLAAEKRPTFAEYFSGSPVHLHLGSKVYAVDLDGQMQGPLDKNTARVEPGRAYWVYTNGSSRYGGPLEVGGVGRDGLDFGTSLVETTLDLRNTTPGAEDVTLRLLSTLAETPPGAPARAGDMRMQVLVTGDGEREWIDLDASGVVLRVDADGVRRVRLRVRRQGLPVALVRVGEQDRAPGGGEGDAGSSYQGELQAKSKNGAQHRLVAKMQVSDHTGLWIGEARLRYVRMVERDPPASGNPPIPAATFETGKTLAQALSSFPDTLGGKDDAPELSFPLILHLGRPDPEGAHVLTLLRQVALLWKEGLRDLQGNITDPGRYVLLTRKGLEANLIQNLGLVGGTLKDGRRFSQLRTAPTFHKDHVLSGPANFSGSGLWSAGITIPALDPLNPFIHRYHPDHGHPKTMRQAGVPAKGGLEVKRTTSLDFSETDPLAGAFEVNGEEITVQPRPEYGDTIFGGTYREVIETLTYDAVVVQGTFELRKAAGGIAKLNDGQAVP